MKFHTTAVLLIRVFTQPGSISAFTPTRAQWRRPAKQPVSSAPPPQNIFSASRASSDMRLVSQGGSKTSVTVVPLTPGTALTASSTHFGISPATGQPGAVSVISMATSRLSETSIL